MAKIFVDALGTEWYVSEIKKGFIPIEEGDVLLFNKEKGFGICPGHLFLQQYAQILKPDENNIPETVQIINDDKQ